MRPIAITLSSSVNLPLRERRRPEKSHATMNAVPPATPSRLPLVPLVTIATAAPAEKRAARSILNQPFFMKVRMVTEPKGIIAAA